MGSNEISRREALKVLGAVTGTTLMNGFPGGLDTRTSLSFLEDAASRPKPARPVTAITLGAGSRGNTYGEYALAFPQELDIVGVAEPIPIRNERYTKKHAIPEGNRFKTWEDVFTRPRFADAVIISTPDPLHYGPCMAALERGYDVLLEKPIAPKE